MNRDANINPTDKDIARSHAAAWKMCDGKKRFETIHSAKRFADKQARAQADWKELRPYACPYCLAFHLTTRVESATGRTK